VSRWSWVRRATSSAAQELKGFAKVELQPGEGKTVSIQLDRRSFAYYDVKAKDWLVETGPVEIRVGSSSRDIRQKTTIQIQAERLSPVNFSLNGIKFDLTAHPAAPATAGPFFARIGSLFHLISASKDEGHAEDTADRPKPSATTDVTETASAADDSFTVKLAEMEAICLCGLSYCFRWAKSRRACSRPWLNSAMRL